MQISSAAPSQERTKELLCIVFGSRYEFVQIYRRQNRKSQQWREDYKTVEATNNEGTFFLHCNRLKINNGIANPQSTPPWAFGTFFLTSFKISSRRRFIHTACGLTRAQALTQPFPKLAIDTG